jgi:hypothetical protein
MTSIKTPHRKMVEFVNANAVSKPSIKNVRCYGRIGFLKRGLLVRFAVMTGVNPL